MATTISDLDLLNTTHLIMTEKKPVKKDTEKVFKEVKQMLTDKIEVTNI